MIVVGVVEELHDQLFTAWERKVAIVFLEVLGGRFGRIGGEEEEGAVQFGAGTEKEGLIESTVGVSG